MDPRVVPVRTDFLGAAQAARLVARHGVVACLAGLADAIEADFARWPDFEKSARIAHHSPGGVIELMPVSDARDYAFKYVNGHPGNTVRGLPTVMAFGALADVTTGLPVFLADLTLATALRTAATSALAARRLARSGSHTMALIGAGSQAEFQALAFTGLLGIEHLRIFDIDPRAMRKLVDNLGHAGIAAQRIACCASSAQALQGADIVTTATAAKQRACVIADADLRPGTHVNAVGGDCPGKTELPAQLLRRARIFTEFTPQTRVEGEIQQLPVDAPVTELWQVIVGQAPGRTHDTEITLFDSVGFALEDYSALRWMHALARDTGLLQTLDLVPTLDDPRDLYRLVREAGQAERGFG
ncbi:ornithine cyclodeaminase [Delftia tsuruhatensis]|uniref:ornithine cyclodeaminase n=1 Tax=Delftia tsuruhatensis TaxID=180282 RepID=UPI001E77014E|nr:ornithine cyclodeaminase [Delftia tsuruhatensis]CAB5720825.1 ornithine cyclodeaminase [Delftia tsuruhatensis]CAC9693734.1 ornithine cyclodeaminase [Delftia tsuruhatensis]